MDSIPTLSSIEILKEKHDGAGGPLDPFFYFGGRKDDVLFLFELQPPHTITRALGSKILDGPRDMLLEYGLADLEAVEQRGVVVGRMDFEILGEGGG